MNLAFSGGLKIAIANELAQDAIASVERLIKISLRRSIGILMDEGKKAMSIR